MTVVLIILIVLAIAVAFIYNGLVRLRVRARNAWADIDVQLKRRHDLIPNIVETVQGYARHESETLESVIQARNSAMSASGPAERAEAENVLTNTLRSLFALSESYPQLRAVESFMGLQRTLEEIENAIQNARRYYNAVVRDLNTRIEQVPSNLVASTFGFQKEEFFGLVDESQREVPRVSFGADAAGGPGT